MVFSSLLIGFENIGVFFKDNDPRCFFSMPESRNARFLGFKARKLGEISLLVLVCLSMDSYVYLHQRSFYTLGLNDHFLLESSSQSFV